MMFGTREIFDYAECLDCKSLFIREVPADMSKFYKGDYYSFDPEIFQSCGTKSTISLRAKLLRLRSKHSLGDRNFLGGLLCLWKGNPPFAGWMNTSGTRKSHRILDVGCGNGGLLMELQIAGFKDLAGIDPFLDSDHTIGSVRLLKRRLEDVQDQYDLVMMHHSFEHIADPASALAEVRRILAPGGQALIRIPVAQSFVHKEYGADWVEWDAPRHLAIPSPDGMKILAERTGLHLEKVIYDGDAFQFIGSELYRRGIPLSGSQPERHFSKKEVKEFSLRAKALNQDGTGGRAAFFLRKQQVPSKA